MNYIDSIISTNLLPPLYYKVLKYFLLYSNIFNDYYAVDLTEHYGNKRGGRQTRIILPTTFYEAQRQNFWYRTGFRINIIQKHLDFFNQLNLKQRLLTLMWKYLKYYGADNNPCTWIFVCLCEPCRANPLISLREFLPVAFPRSPDNNNNNNIGNFGLEKGKISKYLPKRMSS